MRNITLSLRSVETLHDTEVDVVVEKHWYELNLALDACNFHACFEILLTVPLPRLVRPNHLSSNAQSVNI